MLQGQSKYVGLSDRCFSEHTLLVPQVTTSCVQLSSVTFSSQTQGDDHVGVPTLVVTTMVVTTVKPWCLPSADTFATVLQLSGPGKIRMFISVWPSCVFTILLA